MTISERMITEFRGVCPEIKTCIHLCQLWLIFFEDCGDSADRIECLYEEQRNSLSGRGGSW